MTPHPVRYCPACDHLNPHPLFRQSFAWISGLSILGGYGVVRCGSCGMAYADQIPAQSAFDQYYADASKYTLPSESPYDNARFRIIADILAERIPNRAARILDIGCASGGLLHALHHRGFTCLTGLDPSPSCVTAARERGGFAVRQGTIATLDVGQYDLILLIGVLEHLRDVGPLLRRVHHRLAPGGQLYLEVPDAEQFLFHPNAPFQEFSVEHINFFRLASLDHCLRRWGFAPTWMDGTHDRRQSATVTMSNISAMATRSELALPDLPEWPDDGSAIRAYVTHSTEAEGPVRARIHALVKSQVPVILWGVGTHLLRLMATTELQTANIVALLDANPAYWGMRVGDHLIHDPRQAAHWQTPAILISSVPFEAEIRARIAGMKLPNRVGAL